MYGESKLRKFLSKNAKKKKNRERKRNIGKILLTYFVPLFFFSHFHFLVISLFFLFPRCYVKFDKLPKEKIKFKKKN